MIDPNVHVGDDGWLFLVGGTNDTLRYYITENHFSDELAQNWRQLLLLRQMRARQLGADYFHIIAPDKLSVYPEFFRGHLPMAARAPSRLMPQIMNTLGGVSPLIDVRSYFETRKVTSAPFYNKTDTHWSFYGAYAAYEVVCSTLGVEPLQELLSYDYSDRDWLLDLGRKLMPPVRETIRFQRCCNLSRRVSANALVEYKESNGFENDSGLHLGVRVSFENRAPRNPRRLLLFGDSYSEYRDTLLTGMLAETFAEVHFVWHPSLDWEYITELQPDILLTELAERFMNKTPADGISIEAFGAERIAQHKATHGLT
jgi:hypothetical protein